MDRGGEVRLVISLDCCGDRLYFPRLLKLHHSCPNPSTARSVLGEEPHPLSSTQRLLVFFEYCFLFVELLFIHFSPFAIVRLEEILDCVCNE